MKKSLLFSLLIVLIFVSALPVFASMSSENYRIPSSVIAGGGLRTTSDTYEIEGTVGQSSAIGPSSSDNAFNYAGFWSAVMEAVLKGDVNGDGVIDLADAVLAFQTTLGIDVHNIFRSADVNRDGKISIEEVVYVLQNATGTRQ